LQYQNGLSRSSEKNRSRPISRRWRPGLRPYANDQVAHTFFANGFANVLTGLLHHGYLLHGSVLFRPGPDGWLPVGFTAGRNPQPAEAADAERCAENLKRLGLALELACMDHEDRYPFSVSTNPGGTLELQSPGPDGFDQNTHLHLRAFSQQLLDPADLVCPTDTARRPARTLSDLHPDNLSYQIRTGANREPGHGTDVLATCSVHSHHLHVDGTVRKTDPQ
jgi:hypothetical protein